MNTTMKNMARGAIVGMVAAFALIGGLALMKRSNKPKIKQKTNKALRAAGNFIEQLTEMTD